MADAATHGSLSRLPVEVRLHIYEFVFECLLSNAIWIRKFDDDPRLRVCYNPNARIPSILLLSKSIHTEAVPIFRHAARSNPPRIMIAHWYFALHARISPPDVIGARYGFRVRDLSTMRPILQTIESLDLEIRTSTEENKHFALLIQWIVAVLNNQQPPRFRTLVVGVHVKEGMDITHPPDESIVNELAKIDPGVEVTAWTLRRRRWDSVAGPPYGAQYTLPSPPPGTRKLSEHDAWLALQNARSHYYVGTVKPGTKVMVGPQQPWCPPEDEATGDGRGS